MPGSASTVGLLGLLDWLVVVGYTVGLILLGLFMSRRRIGPADYFLASRATTWPVIGVYDSTASAWLKTVTLASGTYSYRNAVSGISIAAGHNLSMGVQTAGVGCATNPGSAQLTMEYTMNQ